MKFPLFFRQLNWTFLCFFLFSQHTAQFQIFEQFIDRNILINPRLCPDHAIGSSYLPLNRSDVQPDVSRYLTIYPAESMRVKSSSIPCQFKLLGSKFNVTITLNSLYQRKAAGRLRSASQCYDRIKFLEIDLQEGQIERNASNPTAMMSFVCHMEKLIQDFSNPKTPDTHVPSELMIRYFKNRVQLEIPYGDDAKYPVFIFVFTINTGTSCFIQVQQHLWMHSTIICNRAAKQKHLKQLCGKYACSDHEKLLRDLMNIREEKTHHVHTTSEDRTDEEPRVEESFDGDELSTTELFLKGLILPTIILWSANLGYIVLKRRMLMLREHQNGSNIVLARAHERYPEDPPPTYEIATCLPTYEEATLQESRPEAEEIK